MIEKGLKASSLPKYRNKETTNAKKKISLTLHGLFRSATGYKEGLKKESFRSEYKMLHGFQCFSTIL